MKSIKNAYLSVVNYIKNTPKRFKDAWETLKVNYKAVMVYVYGDKK